MATNLMSIALDTTDKSNNGALHFLTSVKYSASLMKALNNMTFLYDANWNPAIYGNATLPLSFYFVKKHTELSSSEVSKKKVLLYNTLAESKNPTTAVGGLVNVVADNIVINPKTYKLDILVPFHTDAALDQYQFDIGVTNSVASFIKDGTSTGFTSLTTSGIAILRAIFNAICGTTINISSLANMVLNQNDYNKESLDAMWKNRCILKMKMWNGWKFKYVTIVNLELTKSGEYEGFYEGSMTVQEMPLMTAHPKAAGASAYVKKSGLLDRSLIMNIIKPLTDKEEQNEN